MKDYLFDAQGDIRSRPLDVSRLETMLTKHNGRVLSKVLAAFQQGWPVADASIVEESFIGQHVAGTTDELLDVLDLLWNRLRWALDQLRRLDDERRHKGTLEPEQDSLHHRCDKFVKKLKGLATRKQREAEGHDDTNTYAVLASEGFLPGYGLETGSVRGWAMGSLASGMAEFELPRPSAMALREYAPGNLIYANGSKFYPRYYHLDPQGAREVVHLLVDVPNEAVTEVGLDANTPTDQGNVGLGAIPLRAVPICDVDLPQASQITDDDDYRFQMPVAVYGREQGCHGEGKAFEWGPKQIHLRRNVHLRLVNVGEAKLAQTGTLGFPVAWFVDRAVLRWLLSEIEKNF